MRTRRLCGLTLAVALAHLAAWQLAAGSPPAFAHAGVRRIELAQAADRAPPAAAPVPAVPPAAGEPPPPPSRPPAPRARPRAGPRPAAAAEAEAAADPPAWPTYATRAPPPLTVHYALVPASGASGEAELAWSRDEQGFTLRLATAPAGRAPREWLSAGGFDRAGLAPVRLAEREKGRDKRAVNFDQAARRVRFSGTTAALEIAPGAQDRWSWVAQLAAIAEAAAAPIAPGTTWQLQVAGLRGELDRWTFRVLGGTGPPAGQGNETSGACPWACPLLHVLREPERPYDVRVEAWLAPGLHHFPAGLQMSTPPGSWSLSLWARDGDP